MGCRHAQGRAHEDWRSRNKEGCQMGQRGTDYDCPTSWNRTDIDSGRWFAAQLSKLLDQSSSSHFSTPPNYITHSSVSNSSSIIVNQDEIQRISTFIICQNAIFATAYRDPCKTISSSLTFCIIASLFATRLTLLINSSSDYGHSISLRCVLSNKQRIRNRQHSTLQTRNYFLL